jgi:hypothetical protein
MATAPGSPRRLLPCPLGDGALALRRALRISRALVGLTGQVRSVRLDRRHAVLKRHLLLRTSAR